VVAEPTVAPVIAPEAAHDNVPASAPAPPAAPVAAPARPAAEEAMQDDPSSAFECNICLELAKDPVVTLCGHLYCWPCLYRWMQVQNYCRQCPVCKAGVEVDKVVPIYGRGSENPAPASQDKVVPMPPRPAGQRPSVVQQPMPQPAMPQQQQQAQSQGVLPALFGFQLGPGQGYVEALTPEQQHQAFLSRLLLMLGSFVIMCLLLF